MDLMLNLIFLSLPKTSAFLVQISLRRLYAEGTVIIPQHLSRTKLVKFVSKDIYDALRDLVSFVQFKKREKHPWRSVTFSKVAGCVKQPHYVN